MRRPVMVFVLVALFLALFAAPALALSCPAGKVVWISAYNSANGTYKHVSWHGGNQYFSGTGTHYVNTGRQSNSFVSIATDSSSKSYSEFCVLAGVNSP